MAGRGPESKTETRAYGGAQDLRQNFQVCDAVPRLDLGYSSLIEPHRQNRIGHAEPLLDCLVMLAHDENEIWRRQRLGVMDLVDVADRLPILERERHVARKGALGKTFKGGDDDLKVNFSIGVWEHSQAFCGRSVPKSKHMI